MYLLPDCDIVLLKEYIFFLNIICLKQMPKSLQNNWTSWHHILHKELLDDKNFIPSNSSLLCSVSGGQDSMALLTLFDDIKGQHNWSINVWHGDHRWHVKSDDYAKEVQKFCAKRNIPFYLDTADRIKVASEELARIWRYERLVERSKEISKKIKDKENLYVLTGHTSSDNTETFLLNLARGSSYRGLTGISKKRKLNNKVYLVRPILIFTRNNTTSICNELKIPFWIDPTNSDTKLRRNFIRLQVIKSLEKIYPGCSSRINNLMIKMKNFDIERKDLCELAVSACETKSGIQRLKFNNLGKEARATILNFLFSKNYIKQVSAKNIDSIAAQILNKDNGKINLSNDKLISWDKNFIKFSG